MIDDSDTKITMIVNGEEFTKWQSYEMESDITVPADAFSFVAPNKDGEMRQKIKKGDACKILMDDIVQLDGFVDAVTYSADTNSGANVSIQGRDRFGFLVDCSAPLLHLKNPSLVKIAQEVAGEWIDDWIVDNEENRRYLIANKTAIAKRDLKKAQYRRLLEDLEVKFSDEALSQSQLENAELLEEKANKSKVSLQALKNELYPNLKVEPGETPMDVLQRFAKRLKYLVWATHNGKGVIGQPAYSLLPVYKIRFYPGSDERKQENNVSSHSITETWNSQYSKISVYGTSGNTTAKYGESQLYEGTATDPTISQYRPLIISDGDIKNIKQAKDRAEYEVNKRKFNALTLEYELPGHYNEGLPWQIDQNCDVDDQVAGLKDVYYVTRRKFSGDDSGRHTSITLHERDVWLHG